MIEKLRSIFAFPLAPMLSCFGVAMHAEAKQSLAISLAYNNKLQSWSIESQLGQHNVYERFMLGYGARLSVFRSNSVRLSTADAEDIDSGRIEYLESDSLLLTSLSAVLSSEFVLSGEHSLIMNVDVLGFTFGRSVQLSSLSKQSSGSPSSFNLLVFDNYDRGTLNSHFLLRRKLSAQFSVSAGLAHQFVEYTSKEPFGHDNRRFRLKNNSVVLALAKTFE